MCEVGEPRVGRNERESEGIAFIYGVNEYRLACGGLPPWSEAREHKVVDYF